MFRGDSLNIEKYYGINISELDADNIFFSLINKCREKEIFSQNELLYIDKELSKMIRETAERSGKGYIKQESAKIMLKNIFMILDSTVSVSDFHEIIEIIKQKKLFEFWEKCVLASNKAFDRTLKNFYHLEHFYYANPTLRAEFAIKLKNDYAFSNIYTHSFEKAVFTKAFFALSGNESFAAVAERSEILATECGLLHGKQLSDIKPLLSQRTAFLTDGNIKYTHTLIDAIILSMCYSAFYRCEGLLPNKEYAKDILTELMNEQEEELSKSFNSYLQIVTARENVPILKKEDTYGENILNVYASRVNEENLQLLSRYLAAKVTVKRKTEKGLKTLINFN